MNDIDYEELEKDIAAIVTKHELSYQGMRYAINNHFGVECTCGLKTISHMPYCKVTAMPVVLDCTREDCTHAGHNIFIELLKKK